MTHFNHEWDTTKTPAVPVSVGDRYYAQDLNDDFNYLKHLPYEVFLQGRSRGVMVAPSDTWDSDHNILTLSGGFGVVSQDCIELDPNEDFVIPPKTKSSSRYERISFADTVLPFDSSGGLQYIVATPTKRSLLQRTKAIFTEQYASRIKYDGIITIQNTAPTAGQILIGLRQGSSYCLLIDNNPDQCKDNIILKKWLGDTKIYAPSFISALQSYYNTSTTSIETTISIGTTLEEESGIDSGTFNNCNITINTVPNTSIGIEGTYNNCDISIGTVSSGRGIGGATCNNCVIAIGVIENSGRGLFNGTFKDCTISINTVINGNACGLYNGAYNNCDISIGTVSSGHGGIYNGTFRGCVIFINIVSGGGGFDPHSCDNCTIVINSITSGGIGIDNENNNINNCNITIRGVTLGVGIGGSTFNNCNITFGGVNNGRGIWGDVYLAIFNHCNITFGGGIYGDDYSSTGIEKSTFNNCTITIGAVSGDGNAGIENVFNVVLYLTLIKCSAITDLSSTSGKLNVLNGTVFHAS